MGYLYDALEGAFTFVDSTHLRREGVGILPRCGGGERRWRNQLSSTRISRGFYPYLMAH
jgi:hypothetical protein